MISTRKFLMAAAALVLLSLLISTGYSSVRSPQPTGDDKELYKKLEQLYNVIQANYHEDVEVKDLFSGALNGMLHQLDPHSTFIDVTDYGLMEEQYRGNYQGIGVSFIMIDDKITIMDVVEGGPSERAGLKMGDRIVEIEGESAVGITSNEVQEKLRGPGGSKVNVGIERAGHKDLISVSITRGYIPIRSVENAFMLDDNTGYVRVTRFARPTSSELEQALLQLDSSGMKQLVLDLRGNGGGLLPTAIQLVDKFLSGRRMVVFTGGQTEGSFQQFYTSERGRDWELPLVILIDHFSASASEIVSGSLQDWDRALVIGDTSFGKGVIQSGFILTDNSRLLLTTSQYFTPTGRLIQRPYKGIDLETYQMQGLDDVDPNYLDEEKEVDTDKPTYLTPSGRTVYGGGGITPDIKIDAELMFDPFVYSLSRQFITYFWGREEYWRNPDLDLSFDEYRESFEITDAMMADLLEKARERDFSYYPREGGQFSDAEIAAKFEEVKDDIKLLMKAELAQFHYGREMGYVIRRLARDQVLKEALGHFDLAREIAKNHQDIDPNHFAATVKYEEE